MQFNFDPAARAVEQIESVLAAIAAGDVPVDLGRQLIDSIKALADARAVAELEDRIARLEGANP